MTELLELHTRPLTGMTAMARSTPGTFEMDLAVTAKAVGSARRIVGELVRLWGLEPLADRTGLALSELLTNVLKHVPPTGNTGVPSARFVLTRIPGDGLFLCVHDTEPAPPHMMLASSDDEDGRGMHLVAAYVDEYGVTPAADGGKDVWVTLFDNGAL